jgi:hypothetical protein
MPFMIIYRTSDGVSRYEQSGAIDEAALFVERLRNKDGIDQIRIYRMEEIGFAFRPYYKVELGTSELERSAAPRDEKSRVEIVEALDRPAPQDAVPGENGDSGGSAASPPPPEAAATAEPAAASARQGLFGR